jgi:hypothetical protein
MLAARRFVFCDFNLERPSCCRYGFAAIEGDARKCSKEIAPNSPVGSGLLYNKQSDGLSLVGFRGVRDPEISCWYLPPSCDGLSVRSIRRAFRQVYFKVGMPETRAGRYARFGDVSGSNQGGTGSFESLAHRNFDTLAALSRSCTGES